MDNDLKWIMIWKQNTDIIFYNLLIWIYVWEEHDPEKRKTVLDIEKRKSKENLKKREVSPT